jgi:transcriptional regulator with PAS, ATPase and Fis domain
VDSHPAIPGTADNGLVGAFFETMAEAVLACDLAMTIVAANDAAAQLLGVPPDALTGREASEVLPGGPVAARQGGGASPQRLEWRSRSGRRVLHVSAVPLQGRRSAAAGWALLLKNAGETQEPPEFIGKSPAAQELLEFVSRIAVSRAGCILLEGESGTGKELIARRLHCLSGRASGRFVPINCAAVPENLLESELFGFEQGAFTDAREAKPGLLEIAHGGTLFLDEIGELSLPLQAKLLRVLEGSTFRRLGGTRDILVDLRTVGATNADLQQAIEERRFRSDLYYRLNVIQIRLPALRERIEDIESLAVHFLTQFNQVHGRQIKGIHPDAMRMLEQRAWPGNTRELRNVIERAVLVEPSSLLQAASLTILHGASPRTAAAQHPPSLSIRATEQELIAAALAQTGRNQSRAALLLGIGRFSLRYKMKKLGLLTARSPKAR